MVWQLKKYLLTRNLTRKYDSLKALINKNAFDVVLNHEDALKYSGEFLNINNPIIKTQIIKNGQSINRKALYCIETVSEKITPGKYIILEYECSVNLGSLKYSSCFYEVAFQLEINRIKLIKDKKITSELFNFCKWKARSNIDIDNFLLKEVENISRKMAEKHFAKQYDKISGKIENELQLQKDSLFAMRDKEMSILNAKLKNTVNPRHRKNFIKSIETINSDIENSLKNIPSCDSIIFSPNILICAKIIKE